MKIDDLIQSRDAAASYTTVPLDLGELRDYSIHVELSGSDLVGNFTLETQNDTSYGWVPDPNSLTAITGSADLMLTVYAANYRYARLVWVYTSGTGNIKAKSIRKATYITGM